MGNNTNKISRHYGIERNLGDVIYNNQTKSFTTRLDLGVFSLYLTLAKRQDGEYDLLKSHKDKNGADQVVKLGQTFAATRKDGSIVEGVSKATLGLFREFDKEAQKEITRSNDALFLSVVKLKDPKLLGESGLKKVGFIKGSIGIEIAANNGNESGNNNYQAPEPEFVEAKYDDDEEIPF